MNTQLSGCQGKITDIGRVSDISSKKPSQIVVGKIRKEGGRVSKTKGKHQKVTVSRKGTGDEKGREGGRGYNL